MSDTLKWNQSFKVCRSTYNHRVNVLGWDWEKAANTPPIPPSKSGTYNQHSPWRRDGGAFPHSNGR